MEVKPTQPEDDPIVVPMLYADPTLKKAKRHKLHWITRLFIALLFLALSFYAGWHFGYNASHEDTEPTSRRGQFCHTIPSQLGC